MLTPVILLLAGTGALTNAFASEITHQLLLIPVMFLALYSLPVAWYKSRNYRLLVLTLAGLAGLISARFFHGNLEVILTTAGSLCLIAGHLISFKQCRGN